MATTLRSLPLASAALATSLLGALPLGAAPRRAGVDGPASLCESAPGRWRTPRVGRPSQSVRLGCSERHGVCVHVGRERAAADGSPSPSLPSVELAATWLARATSAAESAFDAADALGLPLPLRDEQRGGDDRYDIYLVADDPSVGAWPDPPSAGFRLDRSSAFARLTPPSAQDHCRFEFWVARALAESSLLGLAAGVDAGTLGAQATYLASLTAPCAGGLLDMVDETQRAPELGVTSCGQGLVCHGWTFPWYLDATYGVAAPGAVMTAAIALAGHRSARLEPWLSAEPDAFDVLRLAARDRGTTLDDMLLDHAVSRAFLGSRSDGAHLPDAAWLGDFGRVRFEWAVSWSSLPRRLAPRAPIWPTGASYLWVDLDRPTEHPSLLFEAAWEPGQLLRWALVKVDAEGREVGRLVPGVPYGQHEVQQTVSELRGAAGLVVVGLAIGPDDRSRPFDPDLCSAPIDYSVTLRPM